VRIIERILAQVETESKQEAGKYAEKGIYRASAIGGCPRALQYTTIGKVKPQEFTPEFQIFLRDGKLHQQAVEDLLRKIGTVSHVEMNLQKRYKHQGVSFVISGTLDGVFNDIIYDVKAINGFSFAALDKNYPANYMKYVEQLTIYLDILSKPLGMLIFKDRNWSEIKIKEVKYDPELMNRILDKIAGLHKGIKEGKLVPRPYKPRDKECKYCPYRLPCQHLPVESKRWIQPNLEQQLRDSIKKVKNEKSFHSSRKN